jgi:hypothetical protein
MTCAVDTVTGVHTFAAVSASASLVNEPRAISAAGNGG